MRPTHPTSDARPQAAQRGPRCDPTRWSMVAAVAFAAATSAALAGPPPATATSTPTPAQAPAVAAPAPVPAQAPATTTSAAKPNQAPTTAAAAIRPAQGPTVDLDTADEAAWSAWIKARLAASRSGRPERIRLPVAIRSQGWGCQCPDAYVGLSANQGVPGPWLSLALGPGVELPEPSVDGAELVVEGHFTGKTVKEDLRNPDGEPEEWLYTLEVLQVDQVRPRPDEAETTATVLGPVARKPNPIKSK